MQRLKYLFFQTQSTPGPEDKLFTYIHIKWLSQGYFLPSAKYFTCSCNTVKLQNLHFHAEREVFTLKVNQTHIGIENVNAIKIYANNRK